jgi:hypothetical protein
MSVPLVSMMWATRFRVECLRDTIEGFLRKARDQTRVELIVRVHEDDPATMEWAAKRDKQRIRVVIGDTEEGYGSADHFINSMAAVANGDWLWAGSDDHKCVSGDWDEVLARACKDPRRELHLLTAKVNNWPNGRIPIMSRGLYTVLGHMGHTGMADCYVDSLSHFAGIQRPSGLEVRDQGLGDVVPRRVMDSWRRYKGEDNCWRFEQDKRKLEAVLGRKLGPWTPKLAPELP